MKRVIVAVKSSSNDLVEATSTETFKEATTAAPPVASIVTARDSSL